MTLFRQMLSNYSIDVISSNPSNYFIDTIPPNPSSYPINRSNSIHHSIHVKLLTFIQLFNRGWTSKSGHMPSIISTTNRQFKSSIVASYHPYTILNGRLPKSTCQSLFFKDLTIPSHHLWPMVTSLILTSAPVAQIYIITNQAELPLISHSMCTPMHSSSSMKHLGTKPFFM